MLSDFIRNHRIVTAIIAVLILGLIGYAAYIAISRAGKEPVSVYLIPNDATLTIGDQQYRAGTAYIKPGTYDITATRDGFESYSDTITIDQQNTAAVDISMTPVTEEAIRWAEENEDLYSAFQARTGERAGEFGQQIREQFPIASKLPFKNYIYSIGHRLKNIDNPSEGIIIVISTITGYREAALDKIRELGFEPTDYEIEFNDNYENPFSHE